MKPGELRALSDEAMLGCAPEYPRHIVLLDRFEMAFDYRWGEKTYWHIWCSGGMGMLTEEEIEMTSHPVE